MVLYYLTHVRTIKLLLTTIAAVLLVGCGESTPDISILDAAEIGDIEAVKQHIAAGTDLNAVGGLLGWTPLHFAAAFGHKEIAELLIAKGADVNAADRDHYTPLDLTKVESWEHPEVKTVKSQIADLLRKHGGKHGSELNTAGE